MTDRESPPTPPPVSRPVAPVDPPPIVDVDPPTPPPPAPSADWYPLVDTPPIGPPPPSAERPPKPAPPSVDQLQLVDASAPAPPPPSADQLPLVEGPPPAPPPPSDALVVVDRVSKWFGDLVAVSDVTFAVRPGVTALLGPNGAGKSTMLRMIAGLARPSSGTVRIMGLDPRSDPTIAAEIGLAPQQEAVFGFITALQFVRASAELQGVEHADMAARQVLRTVELDPDDNRRLPTYSKGMRQRVKLAQAIVHEPRLILLDEPLSGLDPRQRLNMVELFHRLGDTGRAVVVSSHVLEEVERFGSNVVVISQGRLAAHGDFHEIRALMDDRPRRLRITSDRPRSLASALVGQPYVNGISIEGESIIVDTTDVVAFSRLVAPLSKQINARLMELKPLDEDLESVFRYLVGA